MESVLVDANVLVAAYRLDDGLHKRAVAAITKAKGKGIGLCVTNLVLEETATVLSMRVGMSLARKFLDDYKMIVDQEIFVDEALERLVWEVFRNQRRKGTSFVDCANLVTVGRFKLKGLMSFDKFYPKELLV